MAYTYACTGVVDEITALKIEEFDIEVTFKVHGSYKVRRLINQEAFASLKKMQVGQKALVATNCGRLMWVKPK